MRRKSTSSGFFNSTILAVLAGVFILGVGIGIAFSSTATLTPTNVASREFIDRSAPNADLCVQYGASAIVTDTRVFVTLNPFNVYVTQPRMQPGCVLRTNNWSILEQRKAVSGDDVRQCKNRMNTFGYTGDLGDKPQVDCIYQNDAEKNRFLNQPGSIGAPAPETNQF
ncbi:MAG TPA: DUF3172 domain-containing protein [Cyanobacteria bacterium UBA11372]|nr:DUF3172 domain-containing protein [Cyanobacteria bacterium UBA11372]